MNRPILAAAALGLAVVGYLAVSPADAADAVDPAWTYGAAQVNTSATCFPATGMNSRAGLLITNLGPNTIYCGSDSSVTTATGTPVFTNEKFSVGISYRYGTTAGRVQACCITTVLQVSPADTRWAQVR